MLMWLKLRMPFFADFDKKSLKVIADKITCLEFKKDKVITRFGKSAEQMFMVIFGKIGAYNDTHPEKICEDQKPDRVFKEMDIIGEEAVMGEMNWPFSLKVISKCQVLALHRRDLVDSLTTVKETEQRHK